MPENNKKYNPRICPICGNSFVLEKHQPVNTKYCNDACRRRAHSKMKKEYRKKNIERYKQYITKYSDRDRKEAIQHYSDGTMKCLHCGISDIRVLTLDHIKGEGNIHRKKDSGTSNIYGWVRKNKFPKGYQVLCRNCNWIKYLEEDRYA